MHRKVAYQPLRPGALPLREEGEGPLDRPEDRQHAQEDLLAVDGTPPADPEDDQGYEHDDLVQAHDGTGRQGGEPQLRGVLLHGRHFIDSRILHGRLDEVRVRRACAGDIRLRLEVLVEGVPDVDESLHLLVPVGYL